MKQNEGARVTRGGPWLVCNKLFLSSEKNWDLGEASEEHRVQNKGALMFRILQVPAGGYLLISSHGDHDQDRGGKAEHSWPAEFLSRVPPPTPVSPHPRAGSLPV